MLTLELKTGDQLVSFQSEADSLGVKSDQSNRQRQSLVKHLLLEIVKSRQNICRPGQPNKYLSTMGTKKYLPTKIYCKCRRVSREKQHCQDDFLFGRKVSDAEMLSMEPLYQILIPAAADAIAQQCKPLQTSLPFSNKPFGK